MSSNNQNSRATGEASTLGKMVQEAETQRVAKQQVREEARSIRSREMERIRKEEEEKERTEKSSSSSRYDSGRPPAYSSAGKSYLSSKREPASTRIFARRGSEQLAESNAVETRELRSKVQQLEEKFKEAMMVNAQLDNEKQAFRYEIDLLKDKLEDLQDSNNSLQKLFNEKKREYSYQRMQITELEHRVSWLSNQLAARDQLIEEHGLVLVGAGQPPVNGHADSEETNGTTGGMALLSRVTADLLHSLPQGDLESRIRLLFREREELTTRIERLEGRVDEERERADLAAKYDSRNQDNGANSETTGNLKQAAHSSRAQAQEYKMKLQQAQQSITVLETEIIRLEGQVKRYKTIADSCEKEEEDLKLEKRKLQRDLRDAQSKLEDLKSDNSTLQRKLDKLKPSYSSSRS